ncbi:hypothetical protein V2J09_008394 [Rumex salicifolius]
MGRERKMKRKRSDENSLNPPPTIRSLPSQIKSALDSSRKPVWKAFKTLRLQPVYQPQQCWET